MTSSCQHLTVRGKSTKIDFQWVITGIQCYYASVFLESLLKVVLKFDLLFSGSAFDLLKDPAKELNQKLYVDYDQLQTEYKRLKSYIEHLEREYAECKELFDFFRRYQKLKGMIKRLIMYLKLSNNELIDANALHEEESSPGIIKLMQSTREFIKRSEMSKLRKQKHACKFFFFFPK